MRLSWASPNNTSELLLAACVFSFNSGRGATPPATFATCYADASTDVYGGNYAALMHNFWDTNWALSATQLFTAVKNMGVDSPVAFVGMFSAPGEECGCTLCFHSIAPFPAVLGHPTTEPMPSSRTWWMGILQVWRSQMLF